MIFVIMYKELISLPNLKLNACDVGLNSLDFFLVCWQRHFYFIPKSFHSYFLSQEKYSVINDKKSHLLPFSVSITL